MLVCLVRRVAFLKGVASSSRAPWLLHQGQANVLRAHKVSIGLDPLTGRASLTTKPPPPLKSSPGYCISHSSPEPYCISRLRHLTQETFPAEAHRMITPDQGQFLRMLVRSTRAHLVVELGCFTGYGAAWLASGLVAPEGQVVTCERDDQYASIARTWLNQEGWSPRVEVRHQSAEEM